MAEPLYEVYERFEELEGSPTRLREAFDELLRDGLDEIRGAPDDWHNLATIASRAKHWRASLALLEAGAKEWPKDTDLLGGLLQERYGKHYDPSAAEALWAKMQALPAEVSKPYWRFWVYGANYHLRIWTAPVAALALLEEGERHVRRDGLANVLRNYKLAYSDARPTAELTDGAMVAAYQAEASEAMIAKLQSGIDMGVENAYTLAHELATIYQERSLTAGEEKARNHLEEALRYTERAIQLYTGNPNHPLAPILLTRGRILLALGRGRDALDLLLSLPASDRREPSVATMIRWAARITGEEVSDEDDDEEAIPMALSMLLGDGGSLLRQMASANPHVRAVVMHVASGLMAEEES